jgi:hypothetical protein
MPRRGLIGGNVCTGRIHGHGYCDVIIITMLRMLKVPQVCGWWEPCVSRQRLWRVSSRGNFGYASRIGLPESGLVGCACCAPAAFGECGMAPCDMLVVSFGECDCCSWVGLVFRAAGIRALSRIPLTRGMPVRSGGCQSDKRDGSAGRMCLTGVCSYGHRPAGAGACAAVGGSAPLSAGRMAGARRFHSADHLCRVRGCK